MLHCGGQGTFFYYVASVSPEAYNNNKGQKNKYYWFHSSKHFHIITVIMPCFHERVLLWFSLTVVLVTKPLLLNKLCFVQTSFYSHAQIKNIPKADSTE